MVLGKFRPHGPTEGPPVPRGIFPKWPWKEGEKSPFFGGSPQYWMTPEQREEMMRKHGYVATKWAEFMATPRDIEEAEALAKGFKEAVKRGVVGVV